MPIYSEVWYLSPNLSEIFTSKYPIQVPQKYYVIVRTNDKYGLMDGRIDERKQAMTLPLRPQGRMVNSTRFCFISHAIAPDDLAT